MDFMSGLPRTQKDNDSIWVVIDRLTKSTYFLLVKKTYTLDKLTAIYCREIIRLYGILASIISDRDSRFTSKF